MRPSFVKIGGIVYAVEYVQNLRDGDAKLNGWIQYDPSTISIEATMGEQAAAQVMWHEILHGIATQAGRHGELKEQTIDALAYGIVQVLRDNPDLVQMTTEQKKHGQLQAT
jgi:hypothetical protein